MSNWKCRIFHAASMMHRMHQEERDERDGERERACQRTQAARDDGGKVDLVEEEVMY